MTVCEPQIIGQTVPTNVEVTEPIIESKSGEKDLENGDNTILIGS